MRTLRVALIPVVLVYFLSCSTPQPRGLLVRTHTVILKGHLEIGYTQPATSPANISPEDPVRRSN